MSPACFILYTKEQRYQIELNKNSTYHFNASAKATIQLPELTEEESISLSYSKTEEQWLYEQAGIKQPLSVSGTFVEGITYHLLTAATTQVYALNGVNEWRLGTADKNQVVLPIADVQALIHRTGEQWEITNVGKPLYLNNRPLKAITTPLESGDQISSGTIVLKVVANELHVTSETPINVALPPLDRSRFSMYEEYPDYHRSPRIIYRDPEEKIVIAAPPEKPSRPTDELLKTLVPPIIMLAITVLIFIIQPRGIYVLATVATTLLTITFSVTSYLKNRRKFKTEGKERLENYTTYLEKKAMEIHGIHQSQRQGQLYHYPNITTIAEMGAVYHHRIYEKTPLHFDFLYYRLGLGEMKASSEVSSSQTEKQKALDDMELEGQALYENNQVIQEMPVTANLMKGPVGYIGPRHIVVEQLHLLVNQLTFFQSYHDLQIVSVFPEEELADWEWMRWLPHASLHEMNVRGFVYNQRSRDQVLNSLNQILKERKNALEENKNTRESTLFSPHYVVIITDEKLILDHVIMEFFNEDPSELGCSLIFVQDVMSSLSENIKTVIDIKDRTTGELVIEEGELKNNLFTLDHYPETFDKEHLPRLLAPLNHLQNLKSSIPEAVTFLEMYEVERFDELNVLSRWASHSPHKSLAVPLGLRGKGDIVNLNLHEKAHGPHGLVAGTTGSGKSEIVQSYILSLAVNFHPYDVAFLLIDYKGGGMANLFKNLPHLLGAITNLDGAQSMRALISINAELKRRQRLFSENDVNHINQYQKLFKNGDVTEPMPHLFLISDEFAELKSEQPEFMKELVSTARIGRSLGIHLILATQKPSGVVDDQIWSNSKFKLALKVADKADSMEMLKTPDAAEITLPGRSYLQVGNNEIYELFQSAWSGADYQPDKQEQSSEDHTIYRINELGQYEILSEDLSGLENTEDVKQIPTELDAVIEGIHQLVEQQGIETLPSPWLPPLAKRLALPDLMSMDYATAWAGEKQPLTAMLGIVDIPSRQAQEPLELNLSKEGHLAIYSSPGYGKSTFLQTVLLGLARQHNPERLHAYLLDFGTNGLLPLRQLPHIADTIGIDDDEKIGKFIRRMSDELKRRKKLLSEYAVASLEMYERASGKEEPAILIILDSFESFKGMKYDADLEQAITQIAREGAGIGVHLLIASGRQNDLRTNLYSNIKTQIPLKLLDDTEARGIVGRTDHVIEDIAGRGLIKLDDPEIFQAALPTAGEDTLAVIEAIQIEAKAMDMAWEGERPEEIPMVPDDLTLSDFMLRKAVKTQNSYTHTLIPGIDLETVEAVTLNLNESHVLVLADKATKVTQLMDVFQMELTQKGVSDVTYIAAASMDNVEMLYPTITSESDMEQAVTKFAEMLADRIARQSKINVPQYLLINHPKYLFGNLAATTELQLLDLLTEGAQYKLYIVIGADEKAVSESYGDLKRKLKDSAQTVLLMKASDQSVVSTDVKSYGEPALPENEGYYVLDSCARKLKVPK